MRHKAANLRQKSLYCIPKNIICTAKNKHLYSKNSICTAKIVNSKYFHTLSILLCFWQPCCCHETSLKPVNRYTGCAKSFATSRKNSIECHVIGTNYLNAINNFYGYIQVSSLLKYIILAPCSLLQN